MSLGNRLSGFKLNPARARVFLPWIPQSLTCRTRTIMLTLEKGDQGGMLEATQLRGSWGGSNSACLGLDK